MRSYIRKFSSNRVRRLFREASWVVFGQLLTVIGTLLSVRVLTEILEPHIYGQLALGLTLAALVTQAVFGPLSNSATRFYTPATEKSDLFGYLNVVKRHVLYASSIVTSIILILIVILIYIGGNEWGGIAVVALIFALISGCNAILSGIQTAARHRTIVALHQGLEACIRPIVIVGMVWIFGASSTVAISGYIVAVIFILASQYVFFRKTILVSLTGQSKENNWQKKIWAYSWPIGIWAVFAWMQGASDRWVLELFSSTKEVGLYVVLFQLGYYPMLLISNMIAQFLAPILYQRAGDASESQRNADALSLNWKVTGLILGFTGLAYLIALIAHEQIFGLFVSSNYASVAPLLPWMVLASGLFSAGQILALSLMSLMQTRQMMEIKIGSAILGVGLNLIGAYWYGIIGVAIATVLFSLVYLLWVIMATLKKSSGI